MAVRTRSVVIEVSKGNPEEGGFDLLALSRCLSSSTARYKKVTATEVTNHARCLHFLHLSSARELSSSKATKYKMGSSSKASDNPSKVIKTEPLVSHHGKH